MRALIGDFFFLFKGALLVPEKGHSPEVNIGALNLENGRGGTYNKGKWALVKEKGHL